MVAFVALKFSFFESGLQRFATVRVLILKGKTLSVACVALFLPPFRGGQKNATQRIYNLSEFSARCICNGLQRFATCNIEPIKCFCNATKKGK